LVSFFREKSATGVFAIIMLSIALHARILIEPPEIITHPSNGFIHWLLEPLQKINYHVLAGVHQVLVIIAALRLNYILDDLRMFQRQALTTALCYVILSALFISWNNIIPALLINILLIWMFYKLAKSYHAQKPKTLLYNVGLITGGIVLLYYPAVALVMIVIIGLAIIRPFRLNEWFIVILGIITPFYFLAVILFLQDRFDSFQDYLPHLQLHFLQKSSSRALSINIAYVILILVLGVYYWQSNTGRMLIQARKYWNVLFIMLLFIIPVPLFLANSGIESAMLLLVPLASFASNIFLYPRQSLLPGFLFWISVAVVILNQWVFTTY
jgi:hypothetical protein